MNQSKSRGTGAGLQLAVDTSVAVAALDAGHVAHLPCVSLVRESRPALAGHAAFETYSVLTRMPGLVSVDPADAADLMSVVFPDVVWLAAQGHEELRSRLAALGVSGGAVYDALVGEAARTNGCRLLTRDLRARRTYDLLGVDHQLVGF